MQQFVILSTFFMDLKLVGFFFFVIFCKLMLIDFYFDFGLHIIYNIIYFLYIMTSEKYLAYFSSGKA